VPLEIFARRIQRTYSNSPVRDGARGSLVLFIRLQSRGWVLSKLHDQYTLEVIDHGFIDREDHIDDALSCVVISRARFHTGAMAHPEKSFDWGAMERAPYKRGLIFRKPQSAKAKIRRYSLTKGLRQRKQYSESWFAGWIMKALKRVNFLNPADCFAHKLHTGKKPPQPRPCSDKFTSNETRALPFVNLVRQEGNMAVIHIWLSGALDDSRLLADRGGTYGADRPGGSEGEDGWRFLIGMGGGGIAPLHIGDGTQRPVAL